MFLSRPNNDQKELIQEAEIDIEEAHLVLLFCFVKLILKIHEYEFYLIKQVTELIKEID